MYFPVLEIPEQESNKNKLWKKWPFSVQLICRALVVWDWVSSWWLSHEALTWPDTFAYFHSCKIWTSWDSSCYPIACYSANKLKLNSFADTTRDYIKEDNIAVPLKIDMWALPCAFNCKWVCFGYPNAYNLLYTHTLLLTAPIHVYCDVWHFAFYVHTWVNSTIEGVQVVIRIPPSLM